MVAELGILARLLQYAQGTQPDSRPVVVIVASLRGLDQLLLQQSEECIALFQLEAQLSAAAVS